jgi:hypothetical protein
MTVRAVAGNFVSKQKEVLFMYHCMNYLFNRRLFIQSWFLR